MVMTSGISISSINCNNQLHCLNLNFNLPMKFGNFAEFLHQLEKKGDFFLKENTSRLWESKGCVTMSHTFLVLVG